MFHTPYDIMSVSEPERALLILDERRKMGGTVLWY